MRRKAILLVLLVYLLLAAPFSLVVVKDFSGPLAGRAGLGSDGIVNWEFVDIFEYMGFYFRTNLRFTPLPKLDLVNDQVFYPYGTNSAFQSWGFERDLFHAALTRLAGPGPWLQLYYVSTVWITAAGGFLLLLRDYGAARAGLAGFLVSFFNLYAVLKYPHQMDYAVVHWTILGIVADFLIVKRVALRRPVSLRLMLLRSCLLVLALGQDLGYVAGFSLLSFFVSSGYLAGLVLWRARSEPGALARAWRSSREDLRRNRTQLGPLLALALAAAAIHVPLAWQVVRAAREFPEIPAGHKFWANPLRLFVPFLPGLTPGPALDRFFGDESEAPGAGSPGLLLVTLGALGLWQSRRGLTAFAPLLVVLSLCLLFHPEKLPTLELFPWFKFNRVTGRSTVIYPVILCLFALHVSTKGWSGAPRRALLTMLVVLGGLELFAAYSLKSAYRPARLAAGFLQYMDYVQAQPGEAVLDWPFCVSGANSPIPRNALCPSYAANSGVYALRRFHEKKVMGQYLGRMDPKQAQPYLDAGWDELLSPEPSRRGPDGVRRRQIHCFRAQEWQFFREFYERNDFAGINLYVDLLPPGCPAKFYLRFGLPAQQTYVPGAGRVEFLRKTEEQRSRVDKERGKALRFEGIKG